MVTKRAVPMNSTDLIDVHNMFQLLYAHYPFLLDRAFLDCVIDRKVLDITSEAIRSPSERYQNIQDNPEYNSVLPFRIILKIFAVNILTHNTIYHPRKIINFLNNGISKFWYLKIPNET